MATDSAAVFAILEPVGRVVLNGARVSEDCEHSR
jgi:hypothetical protein